MHNLIPDFIALIWKLVQVTSKLVLALTIPILVFARDYKKMALSILGVLVILFSAFAFHQYTIAGAVIGVFAVIGGWNLNTWKKDRKEAASEARAKAAYSLKQQAIKDALTPEDIETEAKKQEYIRILVPIFTHKHPDHPEFSPQYKDPEIDEDPNTTAKNRRFAEQDADNERFAFTAVHVTEFINKGNYYEVTTEVPKGVGLEDSDITKAAPKIASDMNLYNVDAIDHDFAKGTVVMHLFHTQPKRVDFITTTFSYPTDVEPTPLAIPLGVDSFGQRIDLVLEASNCLFGGLPRSGKSVALTTFLYGVSQLEKTAIIGIDPKKVEFSLWRTRMTSVAETADESTVLLKILVAEMNRRYDYLKSVGKKKFSDVTSDDEPFSVVHPRIVIPIDELAELISIGLSKDEKAEDFERQTLIRSLIQKGGAAGIIVIAATQKPSANVIPSGIRDLIQQRIGFATTTRAMTDMILGDGMSSNGGLSHTIAANAKGVCYIVNESSRTPVMGRVYWIPDSEVKSKSAQFADLRIPLPWLEVPFNAAVKTLTEARKAQEARDNAEFMSFSSGAPLLNTLPARPSSVKAAPKVAAAPPVLGIDDSDDLREYLNNVM